MNNWRMYWGIRLGLTAFFYAGIVGMSWSQPVTIRALKIELAQTRTDSARAKICWALGQAYEPIQVDSALCYVQRSIEHAKKSNGNRSQLAAEQYYILGRLYFDQSDFAKSLQSLKAARQFASQAHLHAYQLKIQASIATVYRNQGKYKQGLDIALQTLRSYQQHPDWDQSGISRLYTVLGLLYEDMHKDSQALFYHKGRVHVARQNKDRKDEAISLSNLGQFYLDHHQLSLAESVTSQGLRLAQRQGMDRDVSSICESLGSIAYARQQYGRALHFHQQALTYSRRVGQQEVSGISHLGLSRDYMALKKYPLAFEHITKSTAILQKIGSPEHFQLALAIKSQLLELLGKYEQALLVSQQAEQLKDSLTGLEQQKTLLQLQAQYESERKQQQFMAVQLQLKATQLQLRLVRQQQQSLGIMAGLLLVVLGLIYYSFRRQRQTSQLLQQQKETLTQQAQELSVLNNTKDTLFSLISHDLRSPLARLKYGFSSLRTPSNGTSLPTLAHLEQQLDGVLELLTNLLEWSRTQLTGFAPHSQPIELADAVAEAISILNQHLLQKEIGLLNQVSHDIWVLTDKQQLQSILRNLLGNAIKFTPIGGYIRVYCRQQTDQVTLSIQDTGIGMTAEQLARVMNDPEIRTGTQGELSTGLGLRLVQEIVAQQAGHLCITSNLKQGITVSITLPTAKRLAQEGKTVQEV